MQRNHAAKAIHDRRPVPAAVADALAAARREAPPDQPDAAAQPETQHIVALEGAFTPHPTIPPRIPHTYTEHARTSPEQVLPRIRDATIVLAITTAVTPAVAAQCPRLRLLVVMASGHSWVDGPGLAAAGVTVVNCPRSNVAAVSEHALALYFAVRRRVVANHVETCGSDAWAAEGTLVGRWEGGAPLSCSEEVVGIVGYGALGQRIEGIMKGVGMGEVLVAERKGAAETREGRVHFDEVLRRVSVLVICCPKDASTVDLVGEKELRSMRKDAIVINVARGGIVAEPALAKALRERWIWGAATDVLEAEPGVRGQSLLLPATEAEQLPNLVVSPHVAWYASRTVTTLQQLAIDGIEGFISGKPINVVAEPAR